MDHITTPIFQALFQSDVPRIILNAHPPEYTILDYNSAHQRVTGNEGINHRGQSLWKAYDPAIAGSDGPGLLAAALLQAIEENKLIKMPVFRYDIESSHDNKAVEHWWQLEILPVCKKGSKVSYLLITTNNVTQSLKAEQREQELHEELAASNEELALINEELNSALEDLKYAHGATEQINEELEARINYAIKDIAEKENSLRSLVMTAHYPLMILRGSDWIIEIANQPLVKLWDKTLANVVGHKLMDVLPELTNQPFPNIIRQVYELGGSYNLQEHAFLRDTPTGTKTKYVNIYYDPLHSEDGSVVGVIVAADEVTDQVQQRQLLEESLRNEQTLTEEMTALNEELATTVEELSAANEELVTSQRELHYKHNKLVESEQRFRSLIRQAPVGICMVRAHDLMILEVNDGCLDLVGKTRAELEDHMVWEAVPEAKEIYGPIMEKVINSGIAFVANEHDVFLYRYGKPEKIFVDFVFEPVLDKNAKVVEVMVVAIGVTEKVSARRSIEHAEIRTRMAVESADIGTFELIYGSNATITSERFDEIFDVYKPKSSMDLLRHLHPEDISAIEQARSSAIKDGKLTFEARIIHRDLSIHWIRVQAKVFYLPDGTPNKLLGTILDITDFKRLQQQKDDFISIASHELKTPITSLKASLQLLHRLKNTPNDEMIPILLDQSDRSMKKISSLIDDLLNVSIMNHNNILINKSTFPIMQLLRDCCAHIEESGQYEFIYAGDPLLQVHADEHRIDQVVVNFVNNAIKYAPKSKQIYLSVEKKGDSVQVSVRDNGPGISAEKQRQIFDRYFRADESGGYISGLGLGLYISADIVHRHQGKIGVDSKLGEGATFWFTLPLQP